MTGNLDTILELFSSKERRQLLVKLHRTPGDSVPLTDSELNELETTEVSLVHAHLPKLADSGIIEWDTNNKRISKGERWDEAKPFLDIVINDEHETRDAVS